MSVSYTYIQFQETIAFELGYRTDLLSVPSGFSNIALSPIKQAILTAIAKWEREHFWFNEVEDLDGFDTVNGQEYYTSSDHAAIGTDIHIDKIWIEISSNRYTLNPRTEQYISDISLNPDNTGEPVDYALYAKTLRLYPIPNGAYPVSIEGTKRLAALSASSDTNAWLSDAADLIKAEAKMYIYKHILKNKAAADEEKIAIYGDPSKPEDMGFLDALRSENIQRTAVGKMRSWYF